MAPIALSAARAAALVIASLLVVSVPARAEPPHGGGHHGHAMHGQHGHDQWHETFYQELFIPGTKTSCCNLSDCRPTKVRANGDHYEIMKDGRWIRVDPSKVVKTVAPDGGPHICAPDSSNSRFDKDYVFCIVMPLEAKAPMRTMVAGNWQRDW